jgi:hypothetical protein
MALQVLPGLDKVAKTYATLAQYYIINGYPGWRKAESSPRAAPYVSGNLYNRIGSYNTAARMATIRTTKSLNKVELPQVTISLNFAPPGAEYGEFVEKGTGNSSHVGPKPFAQIAANSDKLKKAVDEAMTGKGGPLDEYMKAIKGQLDSKFAKFGVI